MKILGLDISSSTIGWSLIHFNENTMTVDLVDYGYIKPPPKKKGSFSFRLDETVKSVNKILKQTSPDKIAVEDYALSFTKGKSTANTISVLTAFNEVVCLTSYQFSGKDPERLAVTSIRSLLGKYLGIKTVSKDDVFGIIEGIFSSNQTKNFKPTLNKQGNLKKEFFDVSDSVAVGLSSLYKEYTTKLKQPSS